MNREFQSMQWFIDISLADPASSFTSFIQRIEEKQTTGNAIVARGSSDHVVIAIGDVIAPRAGQHPEQFLHELADDFDYRQVLETSGFFYLFYYSANEKRLELMSGFCSLLPIYYVQHGDHCYVASSVDLLREWGGRINTTYLAERLLFNYPLTGNTLFQNITRLPAHTSLTIENGAPAEHRFFRASELLKTTPRLHHGELDNLVDLFIAEYERFIPEDPFLLSFTAGFDGRTLLGVSQFLGRPPALYSFGTAASSDVQLPKRQAARLGLDYTPILLDSPTYQEASFQSGKKLVLLSSGEANFARAHYHYAVQQFAPHTRYLITGNFGSELFRAFHRVGVMCSKWLYFIFQNDEASVYRALKDAPELTLLHPSISKKEVAEAIVAELQQQYWYSERHHFSLNQRFYLFVFEELFRKYFGPEITMQSHYLYNRAPYLNYRFVKALYETDLGGPYSAFFEKNKIKRMKGQLFYAHVLGKASPKLAKLTTGRGYRPVDLLSWTGRPRLLMGYIKHRLQKSRPSDDAFGVEQAFKINRGQWMAFDSEAALFDQKVLYHGGPGIAPNDWYTALSLNYYLSTLKYAEQSVTR